MHSEFILVLAVIVVASVLVQWLAWWLKLPALILLIITGLVLGPVSGWLNPTEDLGDVLKPFIALSVAIILFEGGLNLSLNDLKQSGVPIRRLVSLGTVLTFSCGTLAAFYLMPMDWAVAMVFGAIIVITGPTVILPLLRQARLRGSTAAIMKWEGIVNDPIGALLAVLIFEYFVGLQAGLSPADTVVALILTIIVSGILGIGLGRFFGFICRRSLVPEFLKAPVMLAMVFIAYILANKIQAEAGMLAVTILGIVIANERIPNLEEIKRFKEYITLLLVSIVFIVLTADIDLEILTRLDIYSALLLGLVIFIIRPVAVFGSTLGAGLSWQERLFVSWIAPRGIVAAATAGLFGPFLYEAGYTGAELLLPLVFALILLTVFLHGVTIRPVARALKLSAGDMGGVLFVGANPWTVDLASVLKEMGLAVVIADTSWHRLQSARMKGIKTYHGEILSERAEHEVELYEITHLLATTSNEAYNALVCTTMAPELGDDKVYMLKDRESDQDQMAEAAIEKVQGRSLLDKSASYYDLMSKRYQGWQFRKTRLTESFSYAEFKNTTDSSTISVALVKESGELYFFPLATGSEPEEGDSLISFSLEAGDR